jgi:GH35 family endo-1,4-beta-xylanase
MMLSGKTPAFFGFSLLLAIVSWAFFSSPVAAAFILKAPHLSIRTVGGEMPPGDARAGSWNIWSNGEIGEYIMFPADGSYRIVVHAAGTPALGEWPRMALLVNGIATGVKTVDSEKFAAYIFEVKLLAGVHRISVAFLNDAAVPDRPGSTRWVEDRNLYVRWIEILPSPGVEPGSKSAAESGAEPDGEPGDKLLEIGSREVWAAEGRKRELQLLRMADEQIEKYRKAGAAIVVLGPDGAPVPGAQVHVNHVRHAFLFGCNIYQWNRYSSNTLNNVYKKRFEEVFNAATIGFYWRWYEWERGKPNYNYTDQVVAWCAERGIRMKGHPLLWACEDGTPVWSNGLPRPRLQKKRVEEIMGRYAASIKYWEVVNEPSHLPGIKIDEPYRWARAAAPGAYLIVNDYNVLATGAPHFFAMLEEAIANGVPFDGIGIQAHEPRTQRFNLDSVVAILDHYATLGKDLHITEFTPTSAGAEIINSYHTGVWDEETQAEYAEEFYRICFAHPAVVAITWWDLSDNGSWLEGGGMLRRDMSPKPVYNRLKKLIHETWHTEETLTTDGEGRAAFRGFQGDYEVTVTVGTKKATFRYHLPSDDVPAAERTWTIHLQD